MENNDLLVDLIKIYFDLPYQLRVEDYLKIVDKIYTYLLTRDKLNTDKSTSYKLFEDENGSTQINNKWYRVEKDD